MTRLATGLLLLLFCPLLLAAEGTPESPKDLKRLPPYCSARLHKTNQADYDRWGSIIGPNFIHIHHYCFGLHKRLLAHSKPDKASRDYWLRSAIQEMTYVEEHAAGKLMLFPEIFTQMGKLHAELGQPAQAAGYLAKAIAVDPAYGPAYSALSDLYVKQGKKDKALEIVNEGLKADPDSPGLLKRLKRLGGTRPAS
jgi:tetratricopeptide (TPR) repeat protein